MSQSVGTAKEQWAADVTDETEVVPLVRSAGAGFVTGQRILVDGGRSLHV